jgi:hypothetical protein
VQSLRPATGCELNLARKRLGRVIGLKPWILKQPQEFCSCTTESHPLTTTSPREVHGVDDSKQAVVKRKLRRSEMLPFFAELASELVGIEARHTAHYWGREIAARGRRPSDAAAICKALCQEPEGPIRSCRSHIVAMIIPLSATCNCLTFCRSGLCALLDRRAVDRTPSWKRRSTRMSGNCSRPSNWNCRDLASRGRFDSGIAS